MEDSFDIHEDARTEETEVMVDEDEVDGQDATTVGEPEEEEVVAEEEEEESSEDEHVETSVQADMERLQEDFPGFRDRYKLIKRIGEGMSI
jgi:cell division control protein 7